MIVAAEVVSAIPILNSGFQEIMVTLCWLEQHDYSRLSVFLATAPPQLYYQLLLLHTTVTTAALATIPAATAADCSCVLLLLHL